MGRPELWVSVGLGFRVSRGSTRLRRAMRYTRQSSQQNTGLRWGGLSYGSAPAKSGQQHTRFQSDLISEKAPVVACFFACGRLAKV